MHAFKSPCDLNRTSSHHNKCLVLLVHSHLILNTKRKEEAMELLQNGHKNLVTLKPTELPLLNGLTQLNSLSETQYLGNIDPSRLFVTKVKRLVVKVLR